MQSRFVIILLGACCVTSLRASDPVKVYILAGQSNMEGKARVSLLEHQIEDPRTRERFAHLHQEGRWIERSDVLIRFHERHGPLTVGFGSPNRIGPELDFGFSMGDHTGSTVLLIKTAWGGKSLYRDFRPPSAGAPSNEVVDRLLTNARKKNPDVNRDEIEQTFGEYYQQMLAEVSETLAHLDRYVPGYEGQGYELSGLAWFQGWNDMVNPVYTAAYAENMADFIRDVRRDLERPSLPIVIGVLGVGGVDEQPPNAKRQIFKDAQSAVGDLPEFQGNVAIVQTDQFWDRIADAVFKDDWKENRDAWEKVGSDYPYHYLGSPTTYCDIGRAFAETLIEMERKNTK